MNDLTPDQANDLAKYFLGPDACVEIIEAPALRTRECILTWQRGVCSVTSHSWRDTFRQAGIKLPVREAGRFVGIGDRVMRGGEQWAVARSRKAADRIANALNLYTPGRDGS